jgi:trimeric autotransporter adhesin
VVGTSTTDRLQIDVSHTVSVRTQVAGQLAYQRGAADSVNVFGFVDENHQSSVNAMLALTRRISTRLSIRLNYQFTAVESTLTPFFSNRINVSGDSGIAGNAQDPLNWGPPTIGFPDFTELTDGSYQRSTRQSHTIGGETQLRRGLHNLTFGGDARLHFINLLTQSDPRGTLSFTGAVTGNGFADFLLGIPSTSAIAFGNESAHIRGGSYDAYFKDDYRFRAGLTFDLGVRWEYEAPYSERDGRLANLDVASGFTDVSVVTGTDPVGALTGTTYPSTLVHRDLLGFEPRLGLSWRPLLASSLVIKAGYGLYRNLGVYQSIGSLLAQQPPFSDSYRVQNSLATPLTLANPFPASQPSRTTFAVDPGYRTALLHSWQVTVQRDFPGSLTMIAAYFADHGTHLAQAFLPNSYPPGELNPCSSCPTGFTYLAAGGTSTRNAVQLIVRRRLYAGFTSTMTYTLANATDNASSFSNTTMSPGSLSVAQNWLDLSAERGPSSFDQRHLVVVDVQYTTGVGMVGGTLVDSIWGKLYKDWTLTAQLNTGSGLPVTPTYFVAVPGTGVVGVRPSLTGQPIAPTEDDSYANPGAFAPPARGSWGDAGRNSIRGPSTFSFDIAVARTFRFNRRFNLDWRVTATNVLNRVTFTTIERSISSPQFGHPTNANQMRRIVTSFIFRF